MPNPVVINPSHWANRGCQAWWQVLPNLAYGTSWPDLLGQYPMTFTKQAGTDARANQIWSPSPGTNAGLLGVAGPHPGAFTSSFVGPLTWASTTYYGSTGINLNNNGIQANGSISLWHCPSVAYNAVSGNDFWFYQGANGGSGNWFGIYFFSSQLNAVQNNGSYFGLQGGVGNALTPAVWSPGRWDHWCFTWAVGDHYRVYVNGQLFLASSDSLPSITLGTGNLLTFGVLPAWSRFSTSAFNDINIWSRQLKAQEVLSAYQQSMEGWPGRSDVRSPRRAFQPQLDFPAFDLSTGSFNYTNDGTGGIFQGGLAAIESSFRPTSGGMAEGGLADVRMVPNVATPPKPNVTINPSYWANRGCQAWWLSLPGQGNGTRFLDVVGTNHATATAISGADARKIPYWSPSPGDADVPATFGPRPGALGPSSFGPFQYGGTPTKWRGATTANFNTLCPSSGTISAWICPAVSAASSQGFWISQGNVVSGPGFYFGCFSGNLEAGFVSSQGASYSPGSEWTPGKWLHVAVTFAISDKVRIYTNGVLRASSASTLGSIATLSATSLIIGSAYDSGAYQYPFAGSIDDLAIWNWQMTDSQILNGFQQSSNGWYGRLTAYSPYHVFQPPFDFPLSVQGPSSYDILATGGMFQGGYPDRTSTWIMPGIGGMTDGGKTSAPALNFGPAASGGLTDGGDTAAPLAWDTFTGSSGTLLTAHTSGDGGAWTKHSSYSSGDARLNGSGAVYSTITQDGVYLHSFPPASANYTVSCDVTHVSDSAISYGGPCARWSSVANTGYYAHLTNQGGNFAKLYKVVAGTVTNLGSTSASWTVGQTKRLSLTVSGTSLNVYLDGSLLIGPVTDSSISSVGQAGLFLRNTEVTFDNWTSTQGGVQAQYHLSASGGEELGGFTAGGNLYVQPCSGGVHQGGHLAANLDFGPTAFGGMKDGGFAPPHLLIVETAAGGTKSGGEMTYIYVVIATGGGMGAGGSPDLPVLAFHPAVSGGLHEGGLAETVGFYIIEPAGGQKLGGTIAILAGISYRLYANDGAGGPIDYSTVIATTPALSYALDPLTGPGVWNFGVRTYDFDSHLEDLNVDAVVTVRLDAANHDITNIPEPPLALTGHAGPAGSAILSWQYHQPDAAKAPTGFGIYQGVGSVDYSSPVATVPWGGRQTLRAIIPGLTDGTSYLFGVRAYNATGEEPNSATVTITAKVAAPSAPASITISAVA